MPEEKEGAILVPTQDIGVTPKSYQPLKDTGFRLSLLITVPGVITSLYLLLISPQEQYWVSSTLGVVFASVASLLWPAYMFVMGERKGSFVIGFIITLFACASVLFVMLNLYLKSLDAQLSEDYNNYLHSREFDESASKALGIPPEQVHEVMIDSKFSL